jgi:hypothetical protein
LIKASGTAEPQDQGEAKETTNGAVDQEEAKPLPTTTTTETVSPALVESPVTPAVVTSEETPTVQMPEDATGSSTSESEKTVVKEDEASATPSEEDSAKSIDVESVASEEKPVDMEEEESAPPKLVTKEETTADERIVEVQPQESEMTIAPEVSQPAAALSETLETPVSDKKRPLEKAVDGDEEDDSEHSPDAKQPRFFSPDKVISHRFYDENNDLMSFLPAGDRRQSRSSTDDRHSSRRRRTKCRDTITGNSGKTGRNGSSSSCNGKPLNHQMTNKFKNWNILFFSRAHILGFFKNQFFFSFINYKLAALGLLHSTVPRMEKTNVPSSTTTTTVSRPCSLPRIILFFHWIFG